MRTRDARLPVADVALLAQLNEQHIDGFMAFRSVREDGRIADFEWIYTNPAAARLVSRSAEELNGRRLLVEMPGNRATDLFERYVEVVERGVAFTREFEYRHEGIDAWFRAVAVPLGDGLAIWFSDVTARIRAERGLQESIARTEAILESISDAFFAIDRDWRFTYVNAAAERLLSRERATLVGTVLWEQFPGAMGTLFEREYRRAAATRQPVAFESFYPPHSAWYHVRAFPQRDGGLSVYFQDVTERIELQASLRTNEARFRKIADAGIVGVAFWKPDGTISEANGAFLKLTGYDRDDLAAGAVSWRRMTPAEWEELDRRALQELEEQGVAAAYEKEYVRKDGTRVPVLISGAYLDDSHTEGVACIVDLTERKHAEEFQRRLIGIAGHDLRSPLTAIVSGAGALSRAEDVPDNRRETARRILSSAARMERIIQDLVDYTRERMGTGIAIERREVDLAKVCRAVVDELSDAFAGRTIELRAEGPSEALVDPARIAQIVQNLVTNALQHGASGRPVGVVVRGERDAVVIEVHNEGREIAANEIPKLFEPFRRGPGERRAGLGLGLFIVERLVAAHGGRIEVRSAAPGGTTFSVRLPREPRAP